MFLQEPVGYGTGKIASVIYGQVHLVHVHKKSYVPELVHNLISLSQARKKGLEVIIDDDKTER